MSDEAEPAEELEEVENLPELISEEDKKAWKDIDGVRVLVLETPFQSGHGMIKEIRLSEPNGFYYEKYGQPYKLISSGKKGNLGDLDEEESVIEIEINVKKLNRYIELCNNPQLGMLEARKMSMTDIKNVHNAMLDFFGK